MNFSIYFEKILEDEVFRLKILDLEICFNLNGA